MRRDELEELHYIAACVNVATMLKDGLLCHDAAENIPHISVADERVQAIRRQIRLVNGRRLHQYVNLYINGRNAMLFAIQRNSSCAVCILKIKTDVLDYDGALIYDGNAAAGWTRPYASPDGLAYLDRDLIFATYWNHDDPVEKEHHKQIMQAEVLVPDRIPVTEITGAYVPNNATKQILMAECPSLSITIKPSLFFYTHAT